jgi:UDP-N-acetylglucosamine--N-acetylmuramyl-(pentapeptide) pyrophosphoryl-undecaprenol N-acetylglucosamine transferase
VGVTNRTPDPVRVVIAGGGTGGHLFPGIAVARELLARRPGAEVSFAGTARGIEARVLPREGFALDLIRSRGLKGKSLLGRVLGTWLLPASLWDASRVLARRRPHLVIGVGGYSSGAVVLMGSLRAIPTMVLEQNAVPGLTNRLLARFVGAAAVTFESTKSYFGGRAFVSGNPVRPEFFEPAPRSREAGADDGSSAVRVLIFGGSQGAHAINLAMVEAAPELAADPRLRLTHQTGERDVEMVRSAYRRAGIQAEVEPFLYDMGKWLREADVIVCRAGATTLAEITAAGRAAILIPLPTATDDHQRKNADALVAAGAAEVVLEREAGIVLARRVRALAGDPDARARMGQAARGLARPDAAKVIVDRALQLIG